MAGTDDAGHAWAEAYDPAVDGIRKSTSDVVTGTAQIADLLSATGINHANADLYAAYSGERTSHYGPFVFHSGSGPYEVPGVPAASGGQNSGGPPGWSIIQKYVGRAWPNGHQDKLHAAASAWRAAADSLGGYVGRVPKAVALLENQQTPEAPAAIKACNDMAGHYQELAASFRDLAQSCDDYAHHIDEAHHKIIVELESLFGVSVFIQGLSWLFPPAEGAEVERLVTTGTRIRSIIDGFVEAVESLTPRMAVVGSRISEVSTKLARLLAARVKLFDGEAQTLAEADEAAAPQLGQGVRTTEEKPLEITRGQVEKKFKHAPDFGVAEPRGKAGFDEFEQAVRRHVDDPATLHIDGTYRGDPVILNFNPNDDIVVIQKPTGEFVSGWRLQPEQAMNVMQRGSL
jgi:hypothetical protein